MEELRHLIIRFVGICVLIVFGHSFAFAQSGFPERYIRVIVPLSPGGGADLSLVPFKDRVAKALGQPLVVSYMPGAAGAIGTALVAKAKPDGYTLLLANKGGLISAPLTKKDVGYTMADFTPVCLLTRSPSIFYVRDDSPYESLLDFIKIAKTKKLNYATYGVLSLSHLATKLLEKHAGFEAIHIPYAGAGEVNVALLGGHVDMAVATSAVKLVGAGKLRAVAVSADKRWELYPNVPTLKELGFPVAKGDPFGAMYSLWAPKGTPKENVDRIYRAFKKVLDEHGREISKGLDNAELNLDFLGPDEFAEVANDEYGLVKRMLEEMGVRPQ